MIYNDIVTNNISFHAISKVNNENVITLFDRKKKHFRTSQTRLRFLLLVLKEHCSKNNISSIKFIDDNIKHYNLPKFNKIIERVFPENGWNISIENSIIKNDIFINIENKFNVHNRVNSINEDKSIPYKTPFIKLEVANIPTVALIDSGATSSVICAEFVKRNKIPIERNSENFRLYDVNGKPLNIKGICNVDLKIGNEYFRERLFVVSNAKLNQPLIICCPFLEKHGFLMDFHKKLLIHDHNFINWIPRDCIVYNEIQNIVLRMN